MASVFSKIISGEFSGLFAWADDRCVAFATIEPISAGHLLVVPRDEVPAFTQADAVIAASTAGLSAPAPRVSGWMAWALLAIAMTARAACSSSGARPRAWPRKPRNSRRR